MFNLNSLFLDTRTWWCSYSNKRTR